MFFRKIFSFLSGLFESREQRLQARFAHHLAMGVMQYILSERESAEKNHDKFSASDNFKNAALEKRNHLYQKSEWQQFALSDPELERFSALAESFPALKQNNKKSFENITELAELYASALLRFAKDRPEELDNVKYYAIDYARKRIGPESYRCDYAGIRWTKPSLAEIFNPPAGKPYAQSPAPQTQPTHVREFSDATRNKFTTVRDKKPPSLSGLPDWLLQAKPISKCDWNCTTAGQGAPTDPTSDLQRSMSEIDDQFQEVFGWPMPEAA